MSGGVARTIWAGVVSCACLLLTCASALAVPLPDERAWEMVSPLDKNGGEINGIGGVQPVNGLPEGGIVQASESGSSVTYVSLLAFENPQGAPLGSQYLSRRKPGEWASENITAPANSKTYTIAGAGAPYEAFSPDLSEGLMLNGDPPYVENPLPEFVEGVSLPSPRYMNHYLRDNNQGKFVGALFTGIPPEESETFFAKLLGVTPDLGHSVLLTTAALTVGATHNGQGNLYESSGGVLQAVNVPPVPLVPGETASGEAALGSGLNEGRTVSDDGSRVFWTRLLGSGGSLFVRDTAPGHQSTVQIDSSEGPDPGGEGEFLTASSTGSVAFFADGNRLTGDSRASGHRHRDLYRFDVGTGHLVDLTPDSEDAEGATVLGVLEASSDGSYLYFVAKGGLAAGATPGAHNLYVWHYTGSVKGSIRFIATLSGDESPGGFYAPGSPHDFTPPLGERTVRLSSDGLHLVFMADNSFGLTGYDNRDVKDPGALDEEVFLYDAASDGLTCVSCNPGGRPSGSSGIPSGTMWNTPDRRGAYQSRVLSEGSGRVFFDSRDALVPQDTNGVQDVYEWERDGVGSCRRVGGCIFLLSGGTSSGDSALVDASASGDDVFFITRAELVGGDSDQLRDLYDARAPHMVGEGVGFPSPPPLVSCEGESCLPAASVAPVFGVSSSATFSGAGNLVQTPKPATVVKSKKRSKPKARKHKSKARGKAGTRRSLESGRGRK